MAIVTVFYISTELFVNIGMYTSEEQTSLNIATRTIELKTRYTTLSM